MPSRSIPIYSPAMNSTIDSQDSSATSPEVVAALVSLGRENASSIPSSQAVGTQPKHGSSSASVSTQILHPYYRVPDHYFGVAHAVPMHHPQAGLNIISPYAIGSGVGVVPAHIPSSNNAGGFGVAAARAAPRYHIGVPASLPYLPYYYTPAVALNGKELTTAKPRPAKKTPASRKHKATPYPNNVSMVATIPTRTVSGDEVPATATSTMWCQETRDEAEGGIPTATVTKSTNATIGRTIKRASRMCKVAGCPNTVVQAGVCIRHGAKRKQCKIEGCNKTVKQAGLCSTHGPARKRCEHEGCSNTAVQGGRCISHGARKRLCEVPGCTKKSKAAWNNMCKRHHDIELQSKLP